MIFPPKTRLSLSGWTLIEQTGLEISLVAERLLLQDTISKLRCDRDMVQKHFNRYLHDTVAHDMAYLQIRLEELKVRPPYLEEKVFHSKINELISVVNQTYNQVRAYLSGLKHNQADDLLTGIREYSQTIARRGNLRVHLEIRGEAIELPLETQQTILLFIREALRNIEKHAGAREAHLRFNWAVNTIEIQIQDDGQGFDYRRKEENPGHIGIQILEDCANELNAQLDIWSEERLGTRISLIIPILKDNSELVE